MEQVDNTWQAIFAKSGLIGDHFALSCLSHIRNDRTIDCKPWSAKYDSCTELTFMLFSHMCLFFLTTNSNLCKLIFYLWIISGSDSKYWILWILSNPDMSNDDSHMALVMVILTSWRLQSTYWNKSIASKFWSFFDWEHCHTGQSEWELLKEKAKIVFWNYIKQFKEPLLKLRL